jgi:hypothetical protein
MRLYVGFTVFQTIVDPADIGRIRAKFGEKMQEMQQTGKLETGGIFADSRQGFVVLNVAAEDEVFMLLGEIADFCVMETHPLVSFETLGRYFAEHPPN